MFVCLKCLIFDPPLFLLVHFTCMPLNVCPFWWVSPLSTLKKIYLTFMNFQIKNRWVKWDIFFCKRNIEYQCFLQSYMYNDNKNIYKVMKKECLCLLNKNTFICWTRFKTAKFLPTAKKLLKNLSEGTLFSVWNIRQFFPQSIHTDKLDPQSPGSFLYVF